MRWDLLEVLLAAVGKRAVAVLRFGGLEGFDVSLLRGLFVLLVARTARASEGGMAVPARVSLVGLAFVGPTLLVVLRGHPLEVRVLQGVIIGVCGPS